MYTRQKYIYTLVDAHILMILDDDDDVYLINYIMAVGYKIYLHTEPTRMA
jgi:hypothetical protein